MLCPPRKPPGVPQCQSPNSAQAQAPLQHARNSQINPPGGEESSSGNSRDLGVNSLLNPAESEASGPPDLGLSVTITKFTQPDLGPAAKFGTAGGQSYTAEPPASEVVQMPTLPGHPLQQDTLSASTSSIALRRGSGSTILALGRAQESQSASLPISASSAGISQTSHDLSPYRSTPQASTSYNSGSSSASLIVQQQGGGVQFQGASGQPEGPYSAPAPKTEGSSRQTSASDSVHVLTFSTPVGTYHVPVDVHQASRLADEKRARNAGASARFRQRRKEKEKEANSNIEKLQQQTRELERKVKEVEQERDFYRAERDRFRDVVYRTPDMRHLVMQAPPSPQSMLPRSFQGPISHIGNPPPLFPPPQMGFQVSGNTSERALKRRRTDVEGVFTSLSPYIAFPALTLPPVQASGCAP